MTRSLALPIATALLLLAAACDRRNPDAPPGPTADPAAAAAPSSPAGGPDLAALHADVPGIAWHDGDMASAFAAATAANKPLLVFWGAQWCPNCRQLKASVFARPDFIEKSKLFIRVYLDGDLPDAQKWADEFQVVGYPTVVVLKPDHSEITRIAGGMDLSLYAGILDTALGDVRPVRALVDLAADGRDPLAADDCRRLAYHAFSLEDGALAPDRLAAAFEGAGARCPAELPRERARFALLAAGALDEARKDAITGGAAPDARHARLIRAVNDVVSDPAMGAVHVDAVAALGSPFFVAARRVSPDLASRLAARWNAIADVAANDPDLSPGDQLNGERLRIAAAQGLAADGKAPAPIAAAAVKRAELMLAAERDSYARGGLIASALFIYLDLNDQERMRSLLVQEAATSNTPWYYLGHLAEVEELGGNKARAVELLAEAWTKAQGPASRFQWGYNYVSGLVRLTPDDTAAVERAGLAVLGELAGPDSVHGRTRIRLEKLAGQLKDWNTTPARAAVANRLDGEIARLQATRT